MRLPDKVKILLVLWAGLIFIIPGCVDTSVQTIPPNINYESQTTFVNLVTGVGAADFTINGQAVNVAFGEESGVLTVPSGSKNIPVTFASGSPVTYSFSLETENKFRVFMVGTDSASDVVKMNLRTTFGTVGTNPDSALVTFFNGSPGATLDAITMIAGADTQTVSFDSPIAYGDFSSLMTFAAGNYSVGFAYNDSLSTNLGFTLNVGAGTKYTVTSYDLPSNMNMKVLTDN
jgi:hypothetical protein